MKETWHGPGASHTSPATPYNEAARGAEASLVTSMGRMAAHTGKVITYEQMASCDHEFAPGVLMNLDSFGDAKVVASSLSAAIMGRVSPRGVWTEATCVLNHFPFHLEEDAMRRSLVLLAVLGILSIGACKPTEPAGPEVSPPAGPVVQEPEGSGDAEPAESAAPEAEASAAKTWDFEDAEAGGVPAGWSVAKTGDGPGGEWQVLEDESAPAGPKVLGQVSLEGPKPVFFLCVADDTSYADVDLSVQFKGVQGKIDQGGGPVWRFQDASITSAGKIGLWVKADAVTSFDGLSVAAPSQ